MGYSKKGKQGFQTKHGLRNHPLYSAWIRIKNRCYNAKSQDYKDYGGRGITVCDLWKDDFVEFLYWALKNGWEKGLSTERKDVNGNYCPENCCWIPLSEQSRNRRCARIIEYCGQKHSISEWARLIGIDRKTLEGRLKSKNYTLNEAFEMPVNKRLSRTKPYKAERSE